MLFYNHKQEFIGIDEEGLKLLNYTSMEDMLGVCSDVADLFAKEPGYIHNFKNFGWIDFLLHADSDATSAIVHGNGRTFSCTLSVQKLFMADAPSVHGYIIDMTHIKSLSGEEIKPHIVAPKPPRENAPVASEKPASDIYAAPSALPDYGYLTPTLLSEPDTLDVPSYSEEEFAADLEPIDDLYAKFSIPPSEEEPAIAEVPPPLPEEKVSLPAAEPRETPVQGGVRYSDAEQGYINSLKIPKSYRFDPRIAANELGLPVDLIQEFIGDFIQQAHDFKEELFEAVLKGDMNNLKILSHKLKGVAANLRIEDAFETLSNINTSDDATEIEANLKYFYSIIAKLENKEENVPEETPPPPPAVQETLMQEIKEEPADFASLPSSQEEEIYAFSLKQDPDASLLVHEEELYAPNEWVDAPSNETPPVQDEELYAYPDITNEPLELASEPESAEEVPLSAVFEEPEERLHYDAGTVAGALGIELPFFIEILEDYKHEASGAAERISGAISAFDTHSWKKTAGELKGISDNLRLSEISDQLAVLSQTNDAQEAHKASKRLIGFIAQL